MIRGVDRKTRKAIKDAAKAEGASVGTWVRRALQRALDASADGPATVMDLSERLRVLGARLSVIEKSHRNLHRKVSATGTTVAPPERETRKRWRPTRKSR
jgi:hypothetical protein